MCVLLCWLAQQACLCRYCSHFSTYSSSREQESYKGYVKVLSASLHMSLYLVLCHKSTSFLQVCLGIWYKSLSPKDILDGYCFSYIIPYLSVPPKHLVWCHAGVMLVKYNMYFVVSCKLYLLCVRDVMILSQPLELSQEKVRCQSILSSLIPLSPVPRPHLQEEENVWWFGLNLQAMHLHMRVIGMQLAICQYICMFVCCHVFTLAISGHLTGERRSVIALAFWMIMRRMPLQAIKNSWNGSMVERFATASQ